MKIRREMRKTNRRLKDAATIALALALAIGASGAILNLRTLNLRILKLRAGFDLEPQSTTIDSPRAGEKSGQSERHNDWSKSDDGSFQLMVRFKSRQSFRAASAPFLPLQEESLVARLSNSISRKRFLFAANEGL
jgi:hypothetical protein